MKKYIPIEKLIKNENVVHILSEARLSGEGGLYLEVLEKNPDREVYKVYVTPKDYNFNKNSLVFLATITRKTVNGIKNWYVQFEGKWKAI